MVVDCICHLELNLFNQTVLNHICIYHGRQSWGWTQGETLCGGEKKPWLGASASLPCYIHELRIVEGHCWKCWCQQKAIHLEVWGRWQCNKTWIWKLLSPLYRLALSSPSILMVLQFNCWQWENIIFVCSAYCMKCAAIYSVMNYVPLCFLNLKKVQYRIHILAIFSGNS